jgi:hypothetical protein
MADERSTECVVIFSGKHAWWTCLDEMDKALKRPTYAWPAGLVAGRLLCDGCRRRKRLREMATARTDAETRPIRRLVEDHGDGES